MVNTCICEVKRLSSVMLCYGNCNNSLVKLFSVECDHRIFFCLHLKVTWADMILILFKLHWGFSQTFVFECGENTAVSFVKVAISVFLQDGRSALSRICKVGSSTLLCGTPALIGVYYGVYWSTALENIYLTRRRKKRWSLTQKWALIPNLIKRLTNIYEGCWKGGFFF